MVGSSLSTARQGALPGQRLGLGPEPDSPLRSPSGWPMLSAMIGTQ